MKVDLLRKERWQNLHFHTTNNVNPNSRNLGNLNKFIDFYLIKQLISNLLFVNQVQTIIYVINFYNFFNKLQLP